MKLLLSALLALCAATGANAQSASVWFPTSIAYSSATPATGFTVGTGVTFLVPGTVNGFVFPKASGDPTTSRNTNLWSTGGTNLAQCTTSSEPTGTQQYIKCILPGPYRVPANSSFVVSYDLPVTVGTNGQLFTGAGTACTNTINTTVISCTGQFFEGPNLTTFPNSSSTSNFYADVIFTPCQGFPGEPSADVFFVPCPVFPQTASLFR